MDFFNSLIQDTEKILEHFSHKSFEYDSNNSWTDLGYNQVVLQRDTAFELDGIGFNLVTSSPVNDEILVIGDDCSEISGNRKFARISIIEIDAVDDEQKAYNLIRKLEYVKYHYFPDGYMIRTTSTSHKENVRVSKTAVKSGVDFQKIGNLLINKYKEIPSVKGVKVIFITDTNMDLNSLTQIAEKNNKIIKALNHVMNTVNFDCDTCNLKAICDEVEGMRELHFKSVEK